jgi:glycerate 2-kinase
MQHGEVLPAGGAALSRLATIDTAGLIDLEGVELIGLTDVNNPLLGERGAARVFGPQKGATPIQVEQLDEALGQFSDVPGQSWLRYRALGLPAAPALACCCSGPGCNRAPTR